MKLDEFKLSLIILQNEKEQEKKELQEQPFNKVSSEQVAYLNGFISALIKVRASINEVTNTVTLDEIIQDKEYEWRMTI